MENENKQALYDYILENFSLSGEAARLIYNIINYVAKQNFTNIEDNSAHLYVILEAIGITEDEIRSVLSTK